MLRISDLIKQLEELKTSLGDVPVLNQYSDYGGRVVSFCEGITEDVIHSGELLDNDVSEDGIKSLFPEWDGEEESLEDMNVEVRVVNFRSGEQIYST